MIRPSRRKVLATLGASAVGFVGCSASSSASTTSPKTTTPETATSTTTAEISTTGPPPAGVEAFEDAVPAFLRQWNIPGASVAVAKEGQLVFTRGYGLADKQCGAPVQPDSLFRIGSISKPVTAVVTLDLIERGQLALDDSVFEILDQFLPDDGPTDHRLTETTVRQHLRHTAGWDNAEIGFDPMFAPIQVAETEGVEPPASADTTVRFLTDQRLGYDPGTSYKYANIGYCTLGRVIEAVTDTAYESHVRENILSPLGISRMEIGATRLDDRLEDEVRYYGHETIESPFPGEGQVPRPYGAGHLPAHDANGGWVGSAIDLLRFVRGVDRRLGPRNLLTAETLDQMTARPNVPNWDGAQQFYGMGWGVIPNGDTAPTLWHDGSLPGSYGFLSHSGNNDLTIAALFNRRAPGRQLQTFTVQAQEMLLETLRNVSTWPDRDLFDQFP
ncbi:serine hydrolase domain-containing protein [Halocatena salina]|uniref:Beta-lactamase family protein n=1 Tax=Halocatena salina TaxID=2934340 RepID=A0A8U0A6L0_9EURY|nr:serine hydrolase domain-containing protein [Halocatena salina]UPM44765.1 beta-lactamase family protein [Halocatena salina]